MLLAMAARGQPNQGMAACRQVTWPGTNYTGLQSFGWPVAVSGDTAMIGLLGEVHVFERVSGIWSYQGMLPSPGVKHGDAFGRVALEGDTAIVGAPLDDTVATNSGAVYLFERVSGVWRRQAKLTASGGMANEWMGNSVALSGSSFVAGTYPPPGAAGAAYVFAKSGTAWNQEAKLIGSPGSLYFGGAVDIDGASGFRVG